MRFQSLLLPSVLLMSMAGAVVAQPNFAPPPPPTKPDEGTLKKIEEKREQLRSAIGAVKDAVHQPGYADVAVYLKAIDWIVRHNEWIGKGIDKQTLTVADEGLRRAKLWKECLADKKEMLPPDGKSVGRGYVSKVDGSVQPYGLSYPAEYGKDKSRKWRVDISLHGRDGTITEVKYLSNNGKATPKDQEYVQIVIFGRGNNAYRWAGEEDVLEAFENFVATETEHGRGGCIDHARIVLKGFSMGGAGTWHLGLQHPSMWAVMQPGAGFVTTHGYIPKLPEKLPYPQEELLTIYDAYRYAENAKQIPVVAYSGEIDGQKASADTIEKELKKLGMPMTHIIAPKLAHVAPKGEFITKIEAEFAKYIGPGKGRDPYPAEVQYVTYTLKFPQAASWIKLLGLDEHYKQSRIHALRKGTACEIETENIHSFEIPLSEVPYKIAEMKIDGKTVALTPAKTLRFMKTGREWTQTSDQSNKAAFPGRKAPGVEGPIDEAFTRGFVCVAPSAKGFHAESDAAVKSVLSHFGQDWDKHLRGLIPMRRIDELKGDYSKKNLILFGDPQSNPLIKKVVDKLPIQWDADKIVVAGKEYSTKDHLPAMIYPNPLTNGETCVVINSGHTFGDAEFNGTNAQLYPRLGDFAVLKWDGKKFETVLNGLFDEEWKVKKQ